MRIRLVAIWMICFLSGCKNDKLPTDILQPKKMQDVLWDVMQADVYVYNFVKKDSSKNAVEEAAKLQQQLFQIHKISREQFQKSYAYYSNNPVLMSALLDSIDLKKNKLNQKITEREKMLLKPLKK